MQSSTQPGTPEQHRVSLRQKSPRGGLREELKQRAWLSFFSDADGNPGEAGRSREQQPQRKRSEFFRADSDLNAERWKQQPCAILLLLSQSIRTC